MAACRCLVCLHPRVRELAQLRSTGFGYNQRGVVATVRPVQARLKLMRAHQPDAPAPATLRLRPSLHELSPSCVNSALDTVSWTAVFDLTAAVLRVCLPQPTATAWQRFLDTGPIALLPVRGGLANVVWTTTPAKVHGGCDPATEHGSAKMPW